MLPPIANRSPRTLSPPHSRSPLLLFLATPLDPSFTNSPAPSPPTATSHLVLAAAVSGRGAIRYVEEAIGLRGTTPTFIGRGAIRYVEEAIGLRGTTPTSIGRGAIRYVEEAIGLRGALPLPHSLTPQGEGGLDWDALSMPGAVEQRTRCVLVQRSCGYSLRETLTVEQIGRIVEIVKRESHQEPWRNDCPQWGYVAGRADLVEAAAARLAAPGISSGAGATSGEVMRLMFQGLFLGPQMTGEAIKPVILSSPARLLTFCLALQGAVILSSPACLLAFCQAVQRRCPVGAYIKPTAGVTAGYESEVSAQPGVTAGYESEVSAQPGVTAGYESEVSAQPGVTAGYELEVSATNAAMLFVALHTKSC
ncbi:unnamed protein product [Closterium sp. Naga37s-1]|nr:unnamed protein product [Closterium sp. Naga37s-1]